MNFFRKLSPTYTPPSLANRGEALILRDKILQAVFLFFAFFGIFSVYTGIQTAMEKSSPALAAIYIVLYVVVILMLVSREMPYGIRGQVATGLLYLLAVSELFDTDMLGEMRVFLVAFSALTAVLFDYRSVIVSIFIGQATITAVGIYVDTTSSPIAPLNHFNDGTHWTISSIMFLSLSIILSGAVTVIISGMQRSVSRLSEMTQSLESERNALEMRIRERTRNINRRMLQLNTAADVTRAISALTDPDKLLQDVVDLVRERFDLYYVGIFLVDHARQAAVLHAGTGEAGKRMISDGHYLALHGSSMIGWAISNRKPRIALDVGTDAVRFNNPHLPQTRSELALPIIIHDTVLGAMSVQSDQPNAFDESDITILESIVDSVAIALENDRLYHETRQNLEEVRALNREYLRRAWAETLESYGSLSYDYENPLSVHNGGAGSAVEVPIKVRNEVIGSIVLEMESSDLSEEEKTFVENVTTQTAIALENARLLYETERRAVQEQKLNELASSFLRANSIDEILRAAAQELGQLPVVAEVSVQLNPAIRSMDEAPAVSFQRGQNGKEHGA